MTAHRHARRQPARLQAPTCWCLCSSALCSGRSRLESCIARAFARASNGRLMCAGRINREAERLREGAAIVDRASIERNEARRRAAGVCELS
eukprot:6198936-Pleurochrysis_carterae.AAC.1